MTTKNRIALLTSNHLRHRWVAAQLAEVAELVCVMTEAKPPQNQGASAVEADEIRAYFHERGQAEARWFQDAPNHLAQIAQQVRELPWQGANTPEVFDLLRGANVTRVFLFGASIIRDPMLAYFKGHIVNMHLGLSPYYRGSATNYWPLVDGQPECVGVTVHHATAIVDGGGILAQARPNMAADDSIHDIGCKTIMTGAALLQRLAHQHGDLAEGVAQTSSGKLCRRGDFNVESLRNMQARMSSGIISDYMAHKIVRDAKYPIVSGCP